MRRPSNLGCIIWQISPRRRSPDESQRTPPTFYLQPSDSIDLELEVRRIGDSIAIGAALCSAGGNDTGQFRFLFRGNAQALRL